MGLPDYPFVVVEHPIGSCSLDQIRDRAQVAYAQAVEILTAN